MDDGPKHIHPSFFETLTQELSYRDLEATLETFIDDLTKAIDGMVEAALTRSWTSVTNQCVAIQVLATTMHAKGIAVTAHGCGVAAKKHNKSEFVAQLLALFMAINNVHQECQQLLEKAMLDAS